MSPYLKGDRYISAAHYFREEYIANQKSNLETRFITQEEYDELIKKIDEYASIVK